MNKPPATRRGDTPVNALTAFVRAASEGRYKGPVALGEAAGFTRQTAAKLLGDDRSVLPKLPPRETLEALARAFPETGLARIEEIANKAVSPHDPDLPPSRDDLARAHTDDLEFELARRRLLLDGANKRRENWAKLLTFGWKVAEQSLPFGTDGSMRGSEGLAPEVREIMNTMWLNSSDSVEGESAVNAALQALGPESVAAMVRFQNRWAGLLWEARECGRRSDRYAKLETRASRIEDDPLPFEEYSEQVGLLKAYGVDILPDENEYAVEFHEDILEKNLSQTAPAVDLQALDRRRRSRAARMGRATSGLGWAARDYPDWAVKPDPQEGPDGGV